MLLVCSHERGEDTVVFVQQGLRSVVLQDDPPLHHNHQVGVQDGVDAMLRGKGEKFISSLPFSLFGRKRVCVRCGVCTHCYRDDCPLSKSRHHHFLQDALLRCHMETSGLRRKHTTTSSLRDDANLLPPPPHSPSASQDVKLHWSRNRIM